MNTQALVEVTRALHSEDLQTRIATLLPPQVDKDRFTEVTISAISNFPEVLEADRDSLYRACLSAAKRGLLPDKEQGALVIYNTNVGNRDQPKWVKNVQFLPMVKGVIMEMAKGGIKAYAVSVYADDEIALWNDDEGQHVHHKPKTFGERGALVGVFAAAKDTGGRTFVEAMSLKDIEQVRARSKQKTSDGKPSGTWASDFDRMAQKSALHRLRKRLPLVEGAEQLDDMDTDVEAVPGAEAAPTTADATSATAEGPASPPPEQQALPAPDPSTRLPNARVSRARRPRVMEQLVPAAAAGMTESEGDII